MKQSQYTLFAVLILIHLWGIPPGYSGISKLKNNSLPPFHHNAYGGCLVSSFPEPPDFILLTWDFILFRILIFILYFAFPIFTFYLIFIKDKILYGWFTMLAWSFLCSFMGLWICFSTRM